MANAAGAIIVSVNYRLAPKHRLPAAYDDCLAALSWLRSEATKTDNDNGRDGDPWLQSLADFSRVFLVGDSAGGNIVHHVIVKGSDWNPLKIRGGGDGATVLRRRATHQLEMESPKDLERSIRSRMMALPEGADRDHPFSNPFATSADYPTLAQPTVSSLLIVIGERDMLRDRAKAYYEGLVKHGKAAQLIVFEEENHGFYVLKQDGKSTHALIQLPASFNHIIDSAQGVKDLSLKLISNCLLLNFTPGKLVTYSVDPKLSFSKRYVVSLVLKCW